LPLLPKQILLNNFLSDLPAFGITNDNVDEDMVKQPHRWNIRFIRNFMIIFGLVSSAFDYATFGLLLLVVRATEQQFQTGWFIESLCTEIFVIFIIRTKKIPFFKSMPSKYLLLTSLAGVALAIAIPFTFIGRFFGFVTPPLLYFGVLVLDPATKKLEWVLSGGFSEQAKLRPNGKAIIEVSGGQERAITFAELDDAARRGAEMLRATRLHEGEPVLTTNAQEDPRFGKQDSVIIHNLRSILCVPLKVKGEGPTVTKQYVVVKKRPQGKRG
jgi:hypothetical protein